MMKQEIKKLTSILVMLGLILTICSNICFLAVDIIETNDSIISDELVPIPDIDDAHYTDDEVIIMLADNEQTETMQFYSIYSDDYATINEDAYPQI